MIPMSTKALGPCYAILVEHFLSHCVSVLLTMFPGSEPLADDISMKRCEQPRFENAVAFEVAKSHDSGDMKKV